MSFLIFVVNIIGVILWNLAEGRDIDTPWKVIIFQHEL